MCCKLLLCEWKVMQTRFVRVQCVANSFCAREMCCKLLLCTCNVLQTGFVRVKCVANWFCAREMCCANWFCAQIREPKISSQNESSRDSVPALTVVESSTLDTTMQVVRPNSLWLARSGLHEKLVRLSAQASADPIWPPSMGDGKTRPANSPRNTEIWSAAGWSEWWWAWRLLLWV